MGDVVRFPHERRKRRDCPTESGIILILPVIRIERDPVLQAFDRMTTAFLDLNEILWHWQP